MSNTDRNHSLPRVHVTDILRTPADDRAAEVTALELGVTRAAAQLAADARAAHGVRLDRIELAMWIRAGLLARVAELKALERRATLPEQNELARCLAVLGVH
jgi:hypothetical protein